MITVNGVPLNNPAMGWIFRPASVPYSGYQMNLGRLDVPGRDGTIQTPSTTAPVMLSLTVNTPPNRLERLQSLFQQPTLVLRRDDKPTVQANARLASVAITRIFPRNEWVDVTFVVEITGSYWRARSLVIENQQLGLTNTMEIAAGITAPIQDAMIRLHNQCTGAQVTDSSGAWIRFPNLAAGQFLRFEARTGRCFQTSTDVWSGGTEVSGKVDFGGPRNWFEMTPVVDPVTLNSSVQLNVLTTSHGDSTFLTVRYRNAYAI